MTNVLKSRSLLEIQLRKRLKSPSLPLKIEETLMHVLLHNRLHFHDFVVWCGLISKVWFTAWSLVVCGIMLFEIRIPAEDICEGFL
jgi:hypothetical protein